MPDPETDRDADPDPEPDLTGRTCLVTGGNRGIGLAIATVLARAGGHVALVCRQPRSGDAAVAAIRAATGSDRLEYFVADLASQRCVRQLAEAVQRRHAVLDVLVNNAAVFEEQRKTTVDGREYTFAVNHLAPFLLTRLLLDRVTAAADGAVVTVAAANHRDIVDGAEDVDSLTGYDARVAYKRSKLANVSFTLELARRLGPAARVDSFHPGVVATRLLMEFRRVPFAERRERLAAEADPDAAAATALRLITTPGTGRYLEDGVAVAPSPLARDPELARRLWDRCSELTGLPAD
jgi:NAD(P)-dependent dehydrogenase (short-subunit alcohol dehydrogenase family)